MVHIDQTKCIGCGKCVRGCPMGVLMLKEKKAEVHPKRRCIECMHCSAGCPIKAVSFDGLTEAQVYPENQGTELEKLLRTRRSIRHFKEELPPKELVKNALDTAMHAPSGKNQRAYGFTVVWGKKQVTELRDECLRRCAESDEAPELVKLQKLGTDLLTCGAPCMIVLWSPDDCLNPVLDAAVAMSQLELLLVEQGLGTCWGGYLRQVSDRFADIRQMLGIPEDSHVRCALMVGYADREKYVRSVYRPEAKAVWLEG